jgi:hypothetical protein
MFKKKEEEKDWKFDKEEEVSCYDCKCLMKKEDAYVVDGMFGNKSYYCHKCKPNYQKVRYGGDYSVYYYREMLVTKEGEPIGYIKIKNKKK